MDAGICIPHVWISLNVNLSVNAVGFSILVKVANYLGSHVGGAIEKTLNPKSSWAVFFLES